MTLNNDTHLCRDEHFAVLYWKHGRFSESSTHWKTPNTGIITLQYTLLLVWLLWPPTATRTLPLPILYKCPIFPQLFHALGQVTQKWTLGNCWNRTVYMPMSFQLPNNIKVMNVNAAPKYTTVCSINHAKHGSTSRAALDDMLAQPQLSSGSSRLR